MLIFFSSQFLQVLGILVLFMDFQHHDILKFLKIKVVCTVAQKCQRQENPQHNN